MSTGTGSLTAKAMKRIQREIADTAKDKDGLLLEGIILSPDPKGDLLRWTLKLKGPKASPYENGTFELSINLPPEYPFEPPEVRFVTRVFHMNVAKTGYICLDTLQKSRDPRSGWNQLFTLAVVAKSVLSLFTDPNPDSPLVSEIAEIYCKNRDKHDRLAYEHTMRYATPTESGSALAPGKSTQHHSNIFDDDDDDYVEILNCNPVAAGTLEIQQDKKRKVIIIDD